MAVTATRHHFASPPGAQACVPDGVLLVDDHRMQREWHADLLRGMGVQRLLEAEDGEQALALLRDAALLPSLLLLDLEMPRMDGFEMLRRLAQFEYQVPVIVVSGGDPAVLDSLAALAEALDVNLIGSLPKPIDLGRLTALLNTLGASRNRRGQIAAEPDGVCGEELQAALRSGWIVADFQPKLDLRSARIDGVEALARWREPGGRSLSPAAFIPLAEREGLIEALTLRMLDCVAAEIGQRAELARSDLRVSVNVSALSLSVPGFAERLHQRIRHSGLPPKRFVFEFTESALASDTAHRRCWPAGAAGSRSPRPGAGRTAHRCRQPGSTPVRSAPDPRRPR